MLAGKRVYGIALIAIAALVAAAVVTVSSSRDLSSLIKTYGYAGIFVTMLISSSTVVFPVPGLALAIAAGSFLNPLVIGPVAGLGAAFGELTGYIAGYGGSKVVGRENAFERAKARVKKYGFLAIFILALIPNPAFDIAGLAAGVLRYPVHKFFLAAVAGNAIKAGAGAYFFYCLKKG